MDEYGQVVEHPYLIVVLWQANSRIAWTTFQKNSYDKNCDKITTLQILIERNWVNTKWHTRRGGLEATTWSTLQFVCIVESS